MFKLDELVVCGDEVFFYNNILFECFDRGIYLLMGIAIYKSIDLYFVAFYIFVF